MYKIGSKPSNRARIKLLVYGKRKEFNCYSTIWTKDPKSLMPVVGLEPTNQQVIDFESTASTIPPYRLLHRAGIEPTTFCLSNRRSTLELSVTIANGERWDSNPYFYSHNITFYLLNYSLATGAGGIRTHNISRAKRAFYLCWTTTQRRRLWDSNPYLSDRQPEILTN